MSELEKTKKEFERHCIENNEVYCTESVILWMLSREQKLKSEAVKLVMEMKMNEVSIDGMSKFDDAFDEGHNTAVKVNNRLLDEAIKKIEGL